MGQITIGEISQSIIAFAAFLGAVSLIINTIKKGKEKTIDEVVEKKIDEKLKPYIETLESINENYEKISEEMGLLIQLNLATVQELKDGKINGKTTEAMNNLSDYIVHQATQYHN